MADQTKKHKKLNQDASTSSEEDDENQLSTRNQESISRSSTIVSQIVEEKSQDEEEKKIEVRLTVQQGSFMPIIGLIARGEIDPAKYVIDMNTGATALHYTGHFGKLKALKTLIEVFKVDPLTQLDSYKLTVAHYAARSGELSTLVYLSKVCQSIMSVPDQYGYTPLHYSVMFSKVYSFIFLYCKLGQRFNPQVIQPTLYQMSASSECLEIVEILLHTPEFKPWIMSILLPTALKRSNFHVVQLILKRTYKELPEQVWTQLFQMVEYPQPQQRAPQPLDIHKEMFVKYLNKYRLKQATEIGKVLSLKRSETSMSFSQLWTYYLNRTWAKCSCLMSFIFIFSSNIFLFYSACYNRRVELGREFSRNDLQNIDPWVAFTLVGYIIMAFGMFGIKAIADPGYLPKQDIDSSDNVLGHLSKEFDTRKIQNLTQLDQVCFTCLRKKQPHEEHCSQVGHCVSKYQCYSSYFDKCIGVNNQRSYYTVMTMCYSLFLSYLVQLIFFSTRQGGWIETKSTYVILRILEFHWDAVFSVHSNWHLTLPLILGWIALISITDIILSMLISIGRGITINELNKPWNYKHNFGLTDPSKAINCGDCQPGPRSRCCQMPQYLQNQLKKVHYKQRWFNLCQNVKNIFVFFFGCTFGQQNKYHRGGRHSNSKNQEGGFIELSDLSKRGNAMNITTTDDV